VLVVHVVNLLGNGEHLLGVETELLLDLLAVVGLEGVAVDAAGTLELGAETFLASAMAFSMLSRSESPSSTC
jgi:hypothetical protein